MTNQVKSCSGKENFHRMNYLYQASIFAKNLSIKSKNAKYKECTDFISNYYSNLTINIAKKTVLRIDTNIKRTICKGCRTLLIPGETARVRVRPKPAPHVRWTCLKCNTFRTYNTDKNHKIWTEQPESLVEILEYETLRDTRNSIKLFLL